MNMTLHKCYYCGRSLRKGYIFNPTYATYVCGNDDKGVIHEYADDGITLEYVAAYEMIGNMHYVVRHYLKDLSCDLIIDNGVDGYNFYMSLNELLVDKITPDNLIDKLKLYLLLS